MTEFAREEGQPGDPPRDRPEQPFKDEPTLRRDRRKRADGWWAHSLVGLWN
jgi:hypothetical protein